MHFFFVRACICIHECTGTLLTRVVCYWTRRGKVRRKTKKGKRKGEWKEKKRNLSVCTYMTKISICILYFFSPSLFYFLSIFSLSISKADHVRPVIILRGMGSCVFMNGKAFRGLKKRRLTDAYLCTRSTYLEMSRYATIFFSSCDARVNERDGYMSCCVCVHRF
ncbi:hypothetical protein F5X99DRAFT_314489 [Biscogniauxia marginata]|nr:hypothetical protein F5X99DRAFT_314489 [Biscogniauxia marginata]